ncbi:hypothetical protein EON81_15490 [bacterium]|nr:MAG: hypothetical protein EON81_15490 [bacterium]
MLSSALALVMMVAAPKYRVTDLHIEPPTEDGVFLNDRGMVAGNVHGVDQPPFFWKAGRLTPLQGVVQVYGLNVRGQLAVTTAEGTGIWEEGKPFRKWPEPKPDGSFHAYQYRPGGIDDAGNLALFGGTPGSEGGSSRMLTWPKGESVPDNFVPIAVAPDGAILAMGSLGPWGSGRLDFGLLLYRNGKGQAIRKPGSGMESLAIARGGWVCGAYSPPEPARRHPLLWHEGRFIELPLAPGMEEGIAIAVNERGEAVGETGHGPALWKAGTVHNLQDLLPADAGYRFVTARAINGRSQILAEAEPNAKPFPRTLLLLTPQR